jgi:hypothetical protein
MIGAITIFAILFTATTPEPWWRVAISGAVKATWTEWTSLSHGNSHQPCPLSGELIVL